MKREACVGAPPILAARVENHLWRAEHLREIVRRKADPALGQIEPELEPHRTAEPGIGAAFRRPRAFDQAAEHHTIVRGQARFQEAEYAHARAGERRRAHHPVCNEDCEKLDIIRRFDRHAGGGFADRQFVERIGKLGAVGPDKGMLRCAVARQSRQHVAVTRGQIAERALAVADVFERRECLGEPAHKFRRRFEIGVEKARARIGAMQIGVFLGAVFGELRAEGVERARQPCAAGARPRPAQDRAFERGDGACIVVHAKPQQRMLEQAEQRDRREPAERGFGGEPREDSRRRLRQHLAAGIFGNDLPSFER